MPQPCSPAFWNLVSSWLDPRTKNKIQILASNYLPVLRSTVPDERIPLFMGGSLKGNHVSNRDDPVTTFYTEMDAYITEQAELAKAQQNSDWDDLQTCRAITVSIPARSKKEICVEVSSCSIVCWEIMVEERDIDFSANFKCSDNSQFVLAKPNRVISDGLGGKVRGRYLHSTGSTGTLTLIFDNSFSILRSKSVRYRSAVMKNRPATTSPTKVDSTKELVSPTVLDSKQPSEPSTTEEYLGWKITSL